MGNMKDSRVHAVYQTAERESQTLFSMGQFWLGVLNLVTKRKLTMILT